MHHDYKVWSVFGFIFSQIHQMVASICKGGSRSRTWQPAPQTCICKHSWHFASCMCFLVTSTDNLIVHSNLLNAPKICYEYATTWTHHKAKKNQTNVNADRFLNNHLYPIYDNVYNLSFFHALLMVFSFLCGKCTQRQSQNSLMICTRWYF